MDLGWRPPLSGGVMLPASGAGPNAPIMGAFHWCRLQWMQEGAPPTLLHWICLGVLLPIWQLPALHALCNHCLSPDQEEFVESEISCLLQEQALCELLPHKQAFLSPIGV